MVARRVLGEKLRVSASVRPGSRSRPMRITRYVHRWEKDVEAETVWFASLEELLAVGWVKQWIDREEFYQLSICFPAMDWTQLLMMESEDDQAWAVIGEITDGDARTLGLPLSPRYPRWEHT